MARETEQGRIRREREALNERRARDEKDQVTVGVMVFLSIAMVLLFLQGIVESLTEGKGVFFMLKIMGCFVGFALPLLVWNSCRYIRYINKRRTEAEYYHFDQNDEVFDDSLEPLMSDVETSMYSVGEREIFEDDEPEITGGLAFRSFSSARSCSTRSP